MFVIYDDKDRLSYLTALILSAFKKARSPWCEEYQLVPLDDILTTPALVNIIAKASGAWGLFSTVQSTELEEVLRHLDRKLSELYVDTTAPIIATTATAVIDIRALFNGTTLTVVEKHIKGPTVTTTRSVSVSLNEEDRVLVKERLGLDLTPSEEVT